MKKNGQIDNGLDEKVLSERVSAPSTVAYREINSLLGPVVISCINDGVSAHATIFT